MLTILLTAALSTLSQRGKAAAVFCPLTWCGYFAAVWLDVLSLMVLFNGWSQ